jgi:hypothetical protein
MDLSFVARVISQVGILDVDLYANRRVLFVSGHAFVSSTHMVTIDNRLSMHNLCLEVAMTLRKRRWKKTRIEGTDGPVEAWTLEDYWLYRNRNYGKEPPVRGKGKKDRYGHYWWFEVFYGGPDRKLLGEAPTLKAAKNLACEDAESAA